MTDEELLHFKNFHEEKVLRISLELQRRNTLQVAAEKSTYPNLGSTHSSGAAVAPEGVKQSGLLSMAMQTRQQYSVPSSPALTSASHATEAARLRYGAGGPQNPSPPPPQSVSVPSRSKGSSPIVPSMAPSTSTTTASGPSVPTVFAVPTNSKAAATVAVTGEHSEVAPSANGSSESYDAKNLRAQVKRSKSGGSESSFAAAAAAIAQKHLQQQSQTKHRSLRASGEMADLLPLFAQPLPLRPEGVHHEPPEDEELQWVFPIPERLHTLRSGALPPNEKMFAMSPASSLHNHSSRSATPAILPRSSSHSPYDHAPQPPHRSQSSTPSQLMASRPHSRLSNSGDQSGDPTSNRPSSNSRNSSTPLGRQRKQRPPLSSSPSCDGTQAHHAETSHVRGNRPPINAFSSLHTKEKDVEGSLSSSPGPLDAANHMRSLAQQSPSLLVCVPKTLPLQQPRGVKRRDDWESAATPTDDDSVQGNDPELESMARAGGLEQVLSSLRHEQQQQQQGQQRTANSSSSSRDNLVQSPFSAFEELSQGSQSLNSNLSMSKRNHRRTNSNSATALTAALHCPAPLTVSGPDLPEANRGKKGTRLRKE